MFGRSKRREAWTEVATALGGEHHLPSKWWRGDESITATIDGAVVKLTSIAWSLDQMNRAT